MSDLNVRVIELPPLQVASVLGFGTEPENLALETMQAWAQANQVDLAKRRVFGFNNPNPTQGSPNYGYEVWVEVEPGMQPGEGAELKHFDGGLYVVTQVMDVEQITPTWQKLSAWLETSPYRMAHHQWLEEHLYFKPSAPGPFVLDLYLPVTR